MEFIYMNEDEINPLLKCSVCKYPFTNPVHIPALDIRLCRECIPKAPALTNKPMDNFSSIDGNIIHMNEGLLLQLLDELRVRCIACQEENIYRKNFANHRLNDCPKRIVPCKASDIKCPWSGRYENYDAHVENCPFERLRPILVESLTHKQQLEKYGEILSKQQNEIELLKNQNQQSNVDDDRIAQLQNQLDKSNESLTNQQNEIEQLKNQNQQSNGEDDRITQLQNQLDKSNELLANQQNEIEQLKNQPSPVTSNDIEQLQSQLDKCNELFANQQNQQSNVEDDRITELQNKLDESNELLTNQQNQIQQLKTSVEQCEHRLTTLQNSFRLILQEKRAREKDNQDSVSISRAQIDEIQQLKDQYAQLIQETKSSSSSNNIDVIDQLKQQVNSFEVGLKQIREQHTNTSNQLNQIQRQDTYRNNELSYLRQCRDKQEIQISLLARKKSVVPRSYTTINAQLDDFIQEYPINSDINLSNKHFDNQDLETICKRTMFDKKCRKLRLENNDINAKGATVIADNLHGNLTLNELYLSENSISDIGAHAIAQVLAINNHSLTWLELHSNSITDEGAEYLADMLKTNKTLILLGLNSNKITNRGAQILVGAITYYNETLQWLLLASNKGITDESIENFNDMFVNNTALQAFWLKDCGLSRNGIRTLKEAVASKANFILEL